MDGRATLTDVAAKGRMKELRVAMMIAALFGLRAVSVIMVSYLLFLIRTPFGWVEI